MLLVQLSKILWYNEMYVVKNCIIYTFPNVTVKKFKLQWKCRVEVQKNCITYRMWNLVGKKPLETSRLV
jgi:hypothetical protein